MSVLSPVTATLALAGLEAILLVGLLPGWINEYRERRRASSLALVAFGSALLFEALLAASFLRFGALSAGDPAAQRALLALRALLVFALGCLAYATAKR